MNNDPITVHVLTTQHLVQPSDFDTDAQDATLLSRGRAVVHAASGCGIHEEWRTPRIESRGPHWREDEWNASASESEIFSTTDLQPFESFVFVSPHPGHNNRDVADPVEVEDRNRSWSVGSAQPPAKRMKMPAMELDTGPLDELIPLPHYVPAPLKPPQPDALSHASLAGDASSSFAPIPPQTTASIGALLSSSYSRVAWLIPVRGYPPWDGVSGASVTLGHLPAPGAGHPPSHDIVWTHSSLRQFWTFLRTFSETPDSSAATGPLSLSFHTAPRWAPIGSQQGTVTPATLAYLPANRETEITPSDRSGHSLSPIRIARTPTTRLTDIDSIKVYCDAPQAMLVRRALSHWAYEESGHAKPPSLSVETTRVLKFSKLVLLNERGEGMLIS
ncbi:hypothetical protein BGW80DRAFT_1303237 [Lactifluus volemus]|nr:hypothetical protein BGW80DRAFT_1303237 [Lactifluus volemus]